MRHPDGRSVAVPVHGSKDLLKGTMRGILTSVGMTPDEFRALL
jgi:predicted RNA binding protein YcfA (HicA-like mRNA interferase family)